MEELSKYNEAIKSQFPNEWFLIGNPQYDGSTVIDGYVLFHSKDKKEVCYIGKDKTTDYNKITLVFSGDIKSYHKNGILKRL